MNYYKIHYEVDNGWDYIRDNAIVKANDEDDAIKKLKSYISNIGNDYFVREVFSVEEFVEEIFSNRFRPSKRKNHIKE